MNSGIKPEIAFIGGGNMASALVGGLLQAGRVPATVLVIEPDDRQRAKVALQFGVLALAVADAQLADVPLVVWAVKPQAFVAAARPCAPHVGKALHLSVMAGIRTDSLIAATRSERVVRAMPNTPALIGQGITGLFATPAASANDRSAVEKVLAPSGDLLWLPRERDLDAVTALSGSGPAYVYYFVEAMIQAAGEMGLTVEQGRRLALATFAGATALAQQSTESPAVLRERVTSKGGTTYAALMSMDNDAVKAAFVRALHAANARAHQLGDEFGAAGNGTVAASAKLR
ncbi:MAG TPA: pyrroline-5-carboxylate reductase [Burkholderiaceae bacterium]|jgi:pyrroline-5-carboxylate reductase|nr:pyrroline-5-carboxylate reductase [Burkholderiaceae bacterium]